MVTEIQITNPNKIIFPQNKIKKIDVAKYYDDVSELMLPFIKNRPLSVIRCPNGISGESFIKKHPTTDKLVEKLNINGEDYFYIKNKTQLIYQAQMGTVEFHPWGCGVLNINAPNVMVFDLDPDEEMPLNALRDGVLKINEVLTELSLTSFLKTSGGKGYHVVVPFKQCKSWQSFYAFSKNVALLAEKRWQNIFTVNIKKSKRKNKIFIDYLRNSMGATCAAPYSLRTKPNAPVSMPIPWESLFSVAPNEVTVKNYKSYLNDAWNGFYNVKQKLV